MVYTRGMEQPTTPRTTDYTATRYAQLGDLSYHLRAVRRALDAIDDAMATDSHGEALWIAEQAHLLAQSAAQIQTYSVGLALFERASWEDIGDLMDLTAEETEERYYRLNGPRRGDHLGTLTRP